MNRFELQKPIHCMSTLNVFALRKARFSDNLALTLENSMKEKQSWKSYMSIYLFVKGICLLF